MSRKPRMYIPGVPCHVIQRGNNRDACFYSEQDYRCYLDHLHDACKRFKVSLHAYVLMTNHTHLLMTPDDEYGISRVMQSLGRRYVQYINSKYRRSGTLWEGRHKASLVDAENYLLVCYRYIEMNPVRAVMVTHPGEYRWSSYRANGQGEENDLLVSHPVYDALGGDVNTRLENYRALFNAGMEPGLISQIRLASSCSMPLGDSRFKEQVEKMLSRSIGCTRRGRPVQSKNKLMQE